MKALKKNMHILQTALAAASPNNYFFSADVPVHVADLQYL